MDLSVVIPTYNGAERLPAVLDRLKAQVDVDAINWEVVVVDNNSSDDPAAVVARYQADWPARVPLRCVPEPRQGLAYARQCGVDQSTGEFVGFLDDDNWATPDWVKQAVKFGRAHPLAGAFGGLTKGNFETPPHDEVKPLFKFLALQNYGSVPKLFEPEKLILPAGAGLVVRRQAWLTSVPTQLSRVAYGGDDYEISLHLTHHDWEVWYCPTLVIEHFIPAKRLERAYLRSLAHRYGTCTCYLMLVGKPRSQQVLLLGRAVLGSGRRIIQHLLNHGIESRKTVEADCRLAFHIGNLKSPFIYASQAFLSR